MQVRSQSITNHMITPAIRRVKRSVSTNFQIKMSVCSSTITIKKACYKIETAD